MTTLVILILTKHQTAHPALKEMKLKILGSPLPSSRVDTEGEMEMDTLGPPQPAVMERKKSRVSLIRLKNLSNILILPQNSLT